MKVLFIHLFPAEFSGYFPLRWMHSRARSRHEQPSFYVPIATGELHPCRFESTRQSVLEGHTFPYSMSSMLQHVKQIKDDMNIIL